MKAVVLAGGKGTRLAPYTKVLPKPLMPIGEDMPILEILLRQLKRHGVNEVTLAVGYSAGLLRAFFQDGKRLGLTLKYSFEDRPLGTAGPLALIPAPREPFLVTNGDVLTTLDFSALIEHHRRSRAVATIASYVKQVRIDLGVIQSGPSQEVVGYSEKPTYSFLVSMGIYVFEPRVLSYIVPGEHLDFPDLVLRMVGGGEVIQSFPFDGYWMDLGRVEDYEQAVADFGRLRPLLLDESSAEIGVAATAEEPTMVRDALIS
jgi:NDP-sugar pyrophosphorylase family protein